MTNDPTLQPSKELAYILGVLKGDGYTSKRSIGLCAKDEVFINSFAEALRRVDLEPHFYRVGPKEEYFDVRVHSKALSNWLRTLGLEDIEKLVQGEVFTRAFIRGFYESEGCYHVQRYSHGNHVDTGVRVQMSNTDRELLELVQRLLNEIGFDFRLSKCTSRPPLKQEYLLLISRKDIAEKFISTINPCIKNGVGLNG